MKIPPPAELAERLRTLPAVAPLLERLGDTRGVYLVGGAVRDLLLGGRPIDLDLVVEGDAAEIAHRLGDDAVIHDRFGTSTVRVGGFTYDIARARTETYVRPGALPEIKPASLQEDLKRRDFTINAIAAGLEGTLTPFPGALDDLGGHQLKVLHDGSFIDDPTRLLRLARYASRLEFEIDSHTLGLALEAMHSDALHTVSGPRVGAELRLLAREPDPVLAFEKLRELGLDTAINRGFGFGLADAALARRALELLPADGRRDVLTLAVAARGDERPEALLDRLGFEAGDRDAIAAAARDADRLSEDLQAASLPSEIAAAVGGAGLEQVALAGALDGSESARRWLEDLRHVRLEIDGDDLLGAGVAQGPAIGEGLRAALDAKLDGHAPDRDSQLQAALRAARD